MEKNSEKTKKNSFRRIALIVICCLVAVVCITAFIFARYVTSDKKSEQAKGAAFGVVNINDTGKNITVSSFDTIIPRNVTISVFESGSGAEVKTRLAVIVHAVSDWVYDSTSNVFNVFTIDTSSSDTATDFPLMSWSPGDGWSYDAAGSDPDSGEYVFYKDFAPNTPFGDNVFMNGITLNLLAGTNSVGDAYAIDWLKDGNNLSFDASLTQLD